MKVAAAGLIFLFFFTGCSKKSNTANDTMLPEITIDNPLNGQTFSPGQLIQINGTITDNNYIAEVHIHVSNINTGALLMDVHIYPATASASFNQSITAAAGINYRIQVIAKDKAINEARATVEVNCN